MFIERGGVSDVSDGRHFDYLKVAENPTTI